MDLYTLAVSIDPNGIVTGVARGGAALDQLGAKAEGMTRKVTSSARASAAAFLSIGSAVVAFLALGTGITSTIRDAQRYEQEMALVATVTDNAAGSARNMSKDTLALFRNLPVDSLSDMSKGMYDVISAGVPAGDALAYMDTAARSAVAGVTTTAIAVDALTTATNAWKSQNMTAQQAADEMFMAVNKGKMTFAQLAGSIGTVAPVAAAYKISLADVLAATAQLTLGGLTASESMVGIRSAITNIISPTGKLAEQFPALAKEFNGAKLEGVGFTRFLLDFNKATGGSKAAINALFSDIQGRTAVFSLLKDGGKALEAQLGNIEHAAGSMSTAFDIAADTSDALYKRLRNELTAQLIELGTAALPMVNAAMRGMLSVLSALNGLKSHTSDLKELGVVLGTVAAMYGVVRVAQLAMATPALVSFVFGVQAAFAAAATAGTGFGGVLVGLRGLVVGGAAWTALSSALFGVQAAFGAAAVAGTGFGGVMAGLAPLLAPVLAVVGPLALALAGVLAVYVTYKAAVTDADAAETEADAKDQDRIRRLVARANARERHKREASAATVQAIADAVVEGEAIKKLTDERMLEVEKLRAVNDAYGKGSEAQQILTIQYEARAQKAKDATEHTVNEAAALNRVTDALAAQKIRTVELAAAKERLDAVEAAAHAKAEAEDARNRSRAESLASIAEQLAMEERLTEAMQGGAAALAWQMEEEEVYQALTAHGLVLGDAAYEQAERDIRQTIRLRKERERLTGVEKELQDAREASAKDAAQATEQAHKKMLSQMQDQLSAYFADLFTKGISTWRDMFGRIKDMFLKLLADMIAAQIMKKIAGMVLGAIGGAADNASSGSNANPLSALPTGKQMLGSAIGGGLAGYGVGQAMYSTSHGSFGNYARGALGGAAAGAATGAMIAGPVGAAVGAVAGFVGGIMGVAKASKEAAAAMQDMQKQVALSMASLRATVNHDDLAANIAAVEADREARRKAIDEAYQGGSAGSEQVRKRAAAQAEMNALEDRRIAQLREEAALAQQYRADDLKVRLLSAQGKSEEADALAFANAQAREYAEYVRNGADAATLALLAQVQAQEKLTQATKTATTGTLNMVTGYRLNAAVYAASVQQASSASSVFTPTRPVPVSGGSTAGSDASSGDLTANIVLDGRIVGSTVLRDFKRRARRNSTTTAANIMDLDERA